MGILTILLFVAMVATFLVMIAGIALMARGGELNTRYGNRLMQTRVLLQGVSLLLLALLLVSK